MELWNLNNFSASLFFLFFRLFLWENDKVDYSLFFFFFFLFLWEDGKVDNSLFFLFFLLFLWEDGKVEDSPDREETGGGKGEENIAINVVVNLRIHKQFS